VKDYYLLTNVFTLRLNYLTEKGMIKETEEEESDDSEDSDVE
jgi:hypothetical protein